MCIYMCLHVSAHICYSCDVYLYARIVVVVSYYFTVYFVTYSDIEKNAAKLKVGVP